MNHSNIQLGWKLFFEQQVSADDQQVAHPARIASIHRSHCVVWGSQGQYDIGIQNFTHPQDLAVGDWILLSNTDHRPLRRLERENELSRRTLTGGAKRQLMAANVDILLIVTACDCDFSESRIERYLVLAAENRVTPVVVLTKTDLCDNAHDLRQVTRKLEPDLQVTCVDARHPDKLAGLERWCQTGKTLALVGPSGVGKSTLINSLARTDIHTQALSHGTNKGRHTTTARSLHPCPHGGILLDTPGIRELQLVTCDHGIDVVFGEVVSLLDRCRFANCSHNTEDGCAIQVAIDAGRLAPRRWENYRKLISERNAHRETRKQRSQRDKAPQRKPS